MVSLTKIRNLIKQYKNRNFRATVQREKSQKYLFREKNDPSQTTKKWNIFEKNKSRLSPFSRFIQEKIQVTQNIASRQEFYLRYIGIFLILACTYIVLYSPYFLISPSKILIEWLDEGIDISIAYRSVEDLYGENIFFLDEKKIANSLKNYQKNISLIRIDRLYPNNIKILLSWYPVIFDVKIAGMESKQWGMTENGILIPKNHLEKLPKYNLFYIDQGINEDILLEYREIMEESKAQIIKKTLEIFEQTWPDLILEKIIYLWRENELHLILKNGTRILFTLQDFTKKTGEVATYKHLRTQLLSLRVFIEKQKSNILWGKYIYIDTRISGKIFTCSEKEVCSKNIMMIYPNNIP